MEQNANTSLVYQYNDMESLISQKEQEIKEIQKIKALSLEQEIVNLNTKVLLTLQM
jgi:hypothetical protein